MHAIETALILVFCANAFSAENPEPRASRYIPQILVAARVVKMEDAGLGWIEAELQVQHVYVGPPDVTDARFSVETTKSGQGSGMIHPLPKKDEAGIWALRKGDDGALVMDHGYTYLCPGLRLPARLGVSPRYEQVRVLAERIQRVTGARTDDRRVLAQQYTRDPLPEVGAWAVYFLGEFGGADALKFIYDLAKDESLSILVQVSVDDVLFKMDPAWGQSKDRFAMFERWVTRDYSGDPYVSRVFNRLDVASQHGGLSQGLLLALVERALTAKKLPGAVLQNLVWLVGTVSERSKDAAASYDILVKFIKESMDHDMRLACAQALKDHVPLNAERMADLRSVLNDLKDQEVKDVVSSAIKNAESNRSQK